MFCFGLRFRNFRNYDVRGVLSSEVFAAELESVQKLAGIEHSHDKLHGVSDVCNAS